VVLIAKLRVDIRTAEVAESRADKGLPARVGEEVITAGQIDRISAKSDGRDLQCGVNADSNAAP